MEVLTREERREIDKFMGKHIGQPNIVSMYNDYNSIMKVVEKLESLGCDYETKNNVCSIRAKDPLYPFEIKTTLGCASHETRFESICNACLQVIRKIKT